ncbi:MAG: hypothetical protein WD080_01030 [Egibacteraceae bacterium]
MTTSTDGDVISSPHGGGDISRGRRVYVARAELVLARDGACPLRELPLKPDPLEGFVRAGGLVRGDLGESASVVVDLLPLSPAEQARHRRQLRAKSGGPGSSGRWQNLWEQARSGAGHPVPPRRSRTGGPDQEIQRLVERRDLRVLADRLTATDVLFGVQVLIRCTSSIRGRPQALLQALVAAWEAWAGHNWLRIHGTHLGVAFLGSDSLWRRRSFDQRFASGRFDPARGGVVTAHEIAGWLKPPTRHCHAPGVARSGGYVPPPPHALPTFTTARRDLLPLGLVTGPEGPRMAGVGLADTYFSYMAGRSRFGKTELAINQFIHLARAGHGCFFLDPHEDGLERIKPHLTDIADRVVEVNLAPRGLDHRQVGWNLFTMHGRRPDELETRLAAVVDSFASALRWGEINNRALTLTAMAAKSLLELSRHLPAELAPTVFQITSLLADADWRAAVLPWLSRDCQAFWSTRFPRLPGDAITPVTNLVDRLSSSTAVKGLLGSPTSAYDVRRCMDAGKVVLACPAGTGDKDRLVANFLVYDLLQAALSRKDTPPERRRPFYVFLDEVQTYDGASRGNLAALLEQSAKYGVRAFLLNQNPERLTAATFDAVTTNRSLLATTTVNARAAAVLAREYAGEVTAQTITKLERFTYLASVTLGRDVTPPFLVRGVPVSEMWADCYRPEDLPALAAAMDQGSGRRRVGDVAAELDGLDGRILEHLQTRRPTAPADAQHGSRPGKPGRASGLVTDALVYDPTKEEPP